MLVCIAVISASLNGCEINGKGQTNHYTIEERSDNTYLYTIYEENGNVAFKQISYRPPTISMLTGSLMEIRKGAGTGTWFSQYFDISTNMLSKIFECAYYIKDNSVVYFVRSGGEIHLILANIFGKDFQDFKCDISADAANITDEIKTVTYKDERHLSVVYYTDAGEEMLVLEVEKFY